MADKHGRHDPGAGRRRRPSGSDQHAASRPASRPASHGHHGWIALSEQQSGHGHHPKTMNIDEFMKTERPGGRRASKLWDWIADLRRLSSTTPPYSIQQMRNYLHANGVDVSASTLHGFLKRHVYESAQSTTAIAPARPAATAAPAPAPETTQPNEGPTQTVGPDAITEIINQRVDLAALSRVAKKARNQRKE